MLGSMVSMLKIPWVMFKQDLQEKPWASDSKESACNAGDPGSIPWPGRSSGEGHGNPLQYSCLDNLMDRGAWWATVHKLQKSRTGLNNKQNILY